MQNRFGLARGLVVALQWLGVAGVGAGLGMAFASGAGTPLADITMWLVGSFGGVLIIAFAQALRAVVILAENSERMMNLVSQLVDAKPVMQKPGRAEPASADLIRLYKGRWLVRHPRGVMVEGDNQIFESERDAEHYIDKL